MRKLASIQTVSELRPIDGADRIEVAQILGWEVVVKKGEFKVGDMCVYVEIDSILPEREEFEFMRERHFKVKTVRLRKQISQGIAFPLGILPANLSVCEDKDVTEVLGITKYEPPTPEERTSTKDGRKPIPRWIPRWIAKLLAKWYPRKFRLQKEFDIWNYVPKTDETRVQNCGGLLKRHEGQRFYATEKLDGSSVTCYLNKGQFGVCSRNIDLVKDSSNAFWEAVMRLDVEAKMRQFFGNHNIAMQGELVGEGIQGNKLKLTGTTIRFFNVYDIDEETYLDYDALVVALALTGLQMVPVVNDDFTLVNDIPAIVAMATMKSTVTPTEWAEGLVFRPVVGGNGKHNRVSFKAINPEFLLKHGE